MPTYFKLWGSVFGVGVMGIEYSCIICVGLFYDELSVFCDEHSPVFLFTGRPLLSVTQVSVARYFKLEFTAAVSEFLEATLPNNITPLKRLLLQEINGY